MMKLYNENNLKLYLDSFWWHLISDANSCRVNSIKIYTYLLSKLTDKRKAGAGLDVLTQLKQLWALEQLFKIFLVSSSVSTSRSLLSTSREIWKFKLGIEYNFIWGNAYLTTLFLQNINLEFHILVNRRHFVSP